MNEPRPDNAARVRRSDVLTAPDVHIFEKEIRAGIRLNAQTEHPMDTVSEKVFWAAHDQIFADPFPSFTQFKERTEPDTVSKAFDAICEKLKYQPDSADSGLASAAAIIDAAREKVIKERKEREAGTPSP